MGLAWDPPEYRKRLISIILHCLSVLVIMTRPWQRPIVRDSLLVIYSIVSLPACTKCVHFAFVEAIVGLFEVTWEFIRAGFWEVFLIL